MRRRIRRPERQNAQLVGELKYSTGRPCKHGHLAPRYTQTAQCVVCAVRRGTISRRKHADRARAADRAWTARNPDKNRAKRSRRRAVERDQLCRCCKPSDFRAVFKAATLLGLEVDHTIPLHLGGMHCVKNLQMLTVDEHRLKSANETRARYRVVA